MRYHLLCGRSQNVGGCSGERDKAAFARIEVLKQQMPESKPVTNLLKGLLEKDTNKRLSALQAMAVEPLASKFPVPAFDRQIRIMSQCVGVTAQAAVSKPRKVCTTTLYLLGRKLSLSPLQGRKGKMSSIETEVKKYWELLECENVTTRLAALRYAEARHQSSKVKVEHCVLLASKVYAWHIAFACNFGDIIDLATVQL